VKNTKLCLCLAGSLILPASAAPGTVIWSDNFDTADTTNFDGAPLTGRLGGTLAAATRLHASRAQQHILGNQLRMISASSGRVRFQNLGQTTWYNWAGGTEAANLLADGGLRVEFDFTPTNSTSTNWVSFNIGHGGQAAGEPATRVNNADTDYGILFRNNGATERFDNGVNRGAGGSIIPDVTARHIVIDYAFDSFADGTTVKTRAYIDGVRVTDETFAWDGNLGELYMEMGTNETGSLIDNLTLSTIPVLYEIAADETEFISGIDENGRVATLSGSTFAKGVEGSTFTLVAGTGDIDNSKFQIVGDELQAGSYDFTQDADGTLYFVRVEGTGGVSGGTAQRELVFTLVKDDDADGLHDAWELQFAETLAELNGQASGPGPGTGTGDFDGDGISDADEYQFGLGLYPGMDPTLADTDGDGLNDPDELNPVAPRLATNPIVADTDKDGLDDSAESNTGTYVDAEDAGTDPLVADTDLDGSRDGFEVEKGSIPTDLASRPPLPPAFSLVEITTDASSGISTDKTYTHAISGGGAATVNGVAFSELSTLVTAENLTWSTNGFSVNHIAPINNGEWLPANGGVTEAGLQGLLGGFTYSGNGDLAGRSQTFTLSGLTPGTTYDFRLYLRPWGVLETGTRRPIDFTFTNGGQVEMPFGALIVDRPGIVLGNGNIDSAYYLSFTYTAEGTELTVEAKVPDSAVGASGSFHMYGLTNEVVPVPAGDLAITGVSRDGGGNIVIDFTGAANTTYDVTRSPDLSTPFGPLTEPLTATTNGAGVGQAIVPATEASESTEFYRIEDQVPMNQ
jgi:hypothetical protein